MGLAKAKVEYGESWVVPMNLYITFCIDEEHHEEHSEEHHEEHHEEHEEQTGWLSLSYLDLRW